MVTRKFFLTGPGTTRISPKRRTLLAGGAVAALAGAGCATQGPQNATGRPIVLVHGAWHGGWCWQRVTPLLTAAGHRVFGINKKAVSR